MIGLVMKIAIIGGGAAGMMAALIAGERLPEAEVILLERNKKLGKKVMISGGGRCNVTTGYHDLKQVLTNYPRGKNFLRTAFYDCSPEFLYNWIEDRGVQLKTQDDMRVFPKSDNGSEFVRMFEQELAEAGVKVRYGTVVTDLNWRNDNFLIEIRDGEILEVNQVILTTGGQAYRRTGSVGDGYRFAEQLGHSVTDLAPSLNSYSCAEEFTERLAGLSFENVDLRLQVEAKYSFAGPMIFTHKGISGPAVFALSALAAYETVTKNDSKNLLIDFVIDVNAEALRQHLENRFKEKRRQQVKGLLYGYVPKRMAELLVELSGMPMARIGAEITKKELNRLVDLLKNFKLTLNEKTPGDEFVTAGGIDLTEVNSKTMESKIQPGLFFAGEILNVDGFTGGFNLHVAWATGMLAGRNLS